MGFVAELKRRNVIRMAGLYLVGAWLVTQVAGTVLPMFGAPEWLPRSVVVVLAIGFVPALVFAWVFELTPAGLKRDADVPPEQSIGVQTARRMERMFLLLLALALGYFAVDKFVLAPRRDAALVAATAQSVKAEAGHAAKPAISEKSIAVLPFVNMSADKDNEYFSDGIAEEILNALAQVKDLKVAGRTSSFQFKGRNEDLRDIGQKLGVASVLEGSVRREGERARITAQLIRASDGVHLWSQTYDRTLQDTLAVQLDIAENVAGALNVLLDDKQRATMRKAGVGDVDAFIHYQKGWKLYLDAHRNQAIDTLAGLRLANKQFDRAIALEPNYSMAHYAKADLYEHTLIDDTTSREERLDAQRAVLLTLERAAATSPDAQQREFALVERQMLSDDWRGIANRLSNALALPGCSAPNWMPVFASAFGYADALEPVLQRAAICDPLNSITWNTRAWVARAAGNAERMQASYAQWRTFQPDLQATPQELLAAAILGREGELQRLPASFDNMTASAYGIAMQVARLRGMDRAQARAWVGPGNRESIKLREWDVVDLVEAALFGDREEANRRAALLDARPAGGLMLAVAVTYCGCGAPFDLSATPNFKARLAESSLPWPPPVAIRYPPLAPEPRP
jgi:TolB-like protein